MRQCCKEEGYNVKAVKKTIEICKNEGTLKEYLEKREAEVVTIMRTLFDQEYAMEIHDYNLKKELTEKAEQEKQETKDQGILIMIASLRDFDVPEAAIKQKIMEKYKLDLDTAAKYMSMPAYDK